MEAQRSKNFKKFYRSTSVIWYTFAGKECYDKMLNEEF